MRYWGGRSGWGWRERWNGVMSCAEESQLRVEPPDGITEMALGPSCMTALARIVCLKSALIGAEVKRRTMGRCATRSISPAFTRSTHSGRGRQSSATNSCQQHNRRAVSWPRRSRRKPRQLRLHRCSGQ